MVANANALAFLPKNGNKIKCGGNILTIPNGGVVGLGNTNVFVNGTPGQNLAPNGVYLVCVFDFGSGVPRADFMTNISHAPDSTAGNEGTEVWSFASSHSVIGLVMTDAAAHFTDIYTLSWFNRRSKVGDQMTGNVSTSSPSIVDLTGALPFITWGDEPIFALFSGQGQDSDNGGFGFVCVGIDSADTVLATYIYGAVGNAVPTQVSGFLQLAEGAHNLTGRGAAASGSGSVYMQNSRLQLRVVG